MSLGQCMHLSYLCPPAPAAAMGCLLWTGPRAAEVHCPSRHLQLVAMSRMVPSLSVCIYSVPHLHEPNTRAAAQGRLPLESPKRPLVPYCTAALETGAGVVRLGLLGALRDRHQAVARLWTASDRPQTSLLPCCQFLPGRASAQTPLVSL